MTSTATRAANQTARAAAAHPSASPAHNTVAASGGAPTTSREPSGPWAVGTAAEHAARNGNPAAKFAAVSMATRIPKLARWIAARPSFTFADAAAASAPSPCSPTVMAYTLPDARLASALAELVYLMTAGGKNGYTVTAIKATAKPKATSAAKTPASS
ncbi:MAG: hypothetical protein ACLQFR_32505 [Streptosporangiaceae bacterium]